MICAVAAVILLAACGKEKDSDTAPDDKAGDMSSQAEISVADKEDKIAVSNSIIIKDPGEEDKLDEPLTVSLNETDETDREEEGFYISEITDEIFERIEGKSFGVDCTLDRNDLRYLHLLHKDINHETHEGEMIVNYHIADDVLDIFRELYENDYPIEKIRLVDEYDADDERSMEDNNSSCFNYRLVPYTNHISKHGRGLAIDINTLYNPYVKTVNGKRIIQPATGEPYLDRDKEFDYKIEKGDLCYNLFIEHGFIWGGEWTNSKDYQHFEIPNDRIGEWYDQ